MVRVTQKVVYSVTHLLLERRSDFFLLKFFQKTVSHNISYITFVVSAFIGPVYKLKPV